MTAMPADKYPKRLFSRNETGEEKKRPRNDQVGNGLGFFYEGKKSCHIMHSCSNKRRAFPLDEDQLLYQLLSL